jgi:hypothetical protein
MAMLTWMVTRKNGARARGSPSTRLRRASSAPIKSTLAYTFAALTHGDGCAESAL